MSLVDVTTALQTAILADPRCPAGMGFAFGFEALAHEDSPPRIIWCPMPSPIEGAVHGGYQQGINPRSVWTRKVTVEAHCWGAASPITTATTQQHYQAAELLLTLLGCAFYTQFEGVLVPSMEDPRKPDNLQLGWNISVTFTIEIPIVMPVDPTAGPPLTGVIATPDPVH